MRDLPILFSGPMVRSILDRSKTQTRRVLRPPRKNPLVQWEPTTFGGAEGGHTIEGATIPLQGGIWHTRTGDCLTCPYGQPGDRLWVRETWRGIVEINPPSKSTELGVARYVPDQEHCRRVEYQATHERDSEPWRPSIHMPRWASRITLEVTSVRVERLQDISYDDAIAEGAADYAKYMADVPRNAIGETVEQTARRLCWPQRNYQLQWDQLNARRGFGWELNPWVWVVEFSRP